MNSSIKLLATDVDGTLTDRRLHISESGELLKSFDSNDLTAMTICGASACPANAANEVKATVDYVCIRNGGDGAVREFVEWIICNNQRGTPC